ncbi:MAG: hypothetical protein OCD00_13690 [Colwellia sp.]
MKSSKLVLFFGLLAIIGGAINGVSDYFLQGGLRFGQAVNTFAYLPKAPFMDVYWGAIFGYASLPLWLAGLLPLYKSLEPAGQKYALPPVIIFGYALALFPGYHYSYAIYAAGFQATLDPQLSSELAMKLLNERLLLTHQGMINVFKFPMVISSLWIAALILSGRTHYKRWMFLMVPMLAPILQPFIEMAPAPFGGILRPAFGTTVFTLFFALATYVYWRANDNNYKSSYFSKSKS